MKEKTRDVFKSLFVNDYFLGNNFQQELNKIKSLGYQLNLASVPRAATELTSNVSGALVYTPQSLKEGALFLNELSNRKDINFDDLLGFFKAIQAKQTARLLQKSSSSQMEVGGDNTSFTTKYGKYTKKINETLLEFPDRAVALPVMLGAFKRNLEASTGKKFTIDDMIKFTKDLEFRENNFKEYTDARRKADLTLSRGYASLNPFESAMQTVSNKNDSALDAFNKFMTRFQVTEANSMLL